MDAAVAALRPRARRSGTGPSTDDGGDRTSCWPARATCPRWRRWPPRPAAQPPARPEGAGGQRGRPDAPAADDSEHPHGLSDAEFDALFTADRPVIFAYHGYPWLIHRLTYRRTNHANIHVRGYKEEGTTTTPVRHGRDERHGPLPPRHRRHRPGAGAAGQRARPAEPADATSGPSTSRTSARHGEDLPEVRDWVWPGGLRPARPRRRRRLAASLRLRVLVDRTHEVQQPRARPDRRRPWSRRRDDARRRARTSLGAGCGRSTRSATGSCTVGPGSPRPCCVDDAAVADLETLIASWRRCTNPRALAGIEPVRDAAARTCRRSPASTPPSTPHAGGRRDLRAAARSGASAGACAATASTASPTLRGPPGRRAASARGPRAARSSLPPRRRRLAGRRRRRPVASTPRWASRRSRAW